MLRLILSPGTEGAQTFDLQPGTYEIGRRPDNRICIPDSSISSLHCKITVEGNTATLKDLNSTNGTFVEGEKTTEICLQHGQQLRFGSIKLLFEEGGSPASRQPPASAPRVRLHVATAVAATDEDQPVIMEPSTGLPAETIPFVADTYCRFHPRSLAQHLCPQCNRFFCDLCVAARHEGHRTAHFCRPCGVKCQPVRSTPTRPHRQAFARLLTSAFAYPLRGSGWMLILGGTSLLVLVDLALSFAGFAGILGLLAMLILSLFGGGYIFSYLKSVILTSAQGSDEMPDWPDFNDWGTDVILPFFQCLGLLTFCFGPTLGLLVYAGLQGNSQLAIGAIGLGLLGVGYFPMAMLGVSMFDGLVGLSPAVVAPSIVIVLGHYVVATAVLVTISTAGAALVVLMEWLVPVPVVSGLLGYPVFFYAIVVESRILGVLYRTNEPRLGWFRPRHHPG